MSESARWPRPVPSLALFWSGGRFEITRLPRSCLPQVSPTRSSHAAYALSALVCTENCVCAQLAASARKEEKKKKHTHTIYASTCGERLLPFESLPETRASVSWTWSKPGSVSKSFSSDVQRDFSPCCVFFNFCCQTGRELMQLETEKRRRRRREENILSSSSSGWWVCVCVFIHRFLLSCLLRWNTAIQSAGPKWAHTHTIQDTHRQRHPRRHTHPKQTQIQMKRL